MDGLLEALEVIWADVLFGSLPIWTITHVRFYLSRLCFFNFNGIIINWTKLNSSVERGQSRLTLLASFHFPKALTTLHAHFIKNTKMAAVTVNFLTF